MKMYIDYKNDTKTVKGVYPSDWDMTNVRRPYTYTVDDNVWVDLLSRLKGHQRVVFDASGVPTVEDIPWTEDERQAERCTEYDYTMAQRDRWSGLAELGLMTAEEFHTKELAILRYREEVRATQTQAGYPDTVVYPPRPV